MQAEQLMSLNFVCRCAQQLRQLADLLSSRGIGLPGR